MSQATVLGFLEGKEYNRFMAELDREIVTSDGMGMGWGGSAMSETSNLELPTELKLRIERVAKERDEEPATLLSGAIDSLLMIEEAQIAEVRRRDATDTGEV